MPMLMIVKYKSRLLDREIFSVHPSKENHFKKIYKIVVNNGQIKPAPNYSTSEGRRKTSSTLVNMGLSRQCHTAVIKAWNVKLRQVMQVSRKMQGKELLVSGWPAPTMGVVSFLLLVFSLACANALVITRTPFNQPDFFSIGFTKNI